MAEIDPPLCGTVMGEVVKPDPLLREISKPVGGVISISAVRSLPETVYVDSDE